MGKVYTATWRLTKELDGVAGRRVSCGDRTVFIWSDVSTGGGGGSGGIAPHLRKWGGPQYGSTPHFLEQSC